MDQAARLLDYEISRGRSTPERKTEILARIHPTADFSGLKDVDLVIEAEFEERNVKAEATKKADAVTRDTAIFGSNTSTLPITGLAEASARPKSFIGIHFFSPAGRMGRVGSIVGAQHSERARRRPLD